MKSDNYPRHIETIWLALEIGNSRLHWGVFFGDTLNCTWDTEYLPESVIQDLAECQTLDDFLEILGQGDKGTRGQGDKGTKGQGDKGTRRQGDDLPPIPLSPPLPIPPSPHPLPLTIASVVPQQTALWQSYPNVRVITLEQIPLKDIYPTLGIDRALALWGAGMRWGFPMLVIDGGTALTFTAGDTHQSLVGGAILPGLGLQFASLGQKTGQLPQVKIEAIKDLPQRFALNTPAAIESGVIYTLVAGIKDFVEEWWRLFPEGKIAIKGGDRQLLLHYLQELYPAIASRLIVEPNLIFWGMREIVIN